MRSFLFVVLAGFLSTSFVGCVLQAPVVPPLGGVYSHVKAPLDVDLKETPMGSKRGEASVISVLGIVSTGDASIQAAAEDGGITTIEAADYQFMNVLGFIYTKYTTIVYGE